MPSPSSFMWRRYSTLLLQLQAIVSGVTRLSGLETYLGHAETRDSASSRPEGLAEASQPEGSSLNRVRVRRQTWLAVSVRDLGPKNRDEANSNPPASGSPAPHQYRF